MFNVRLSLAAHFSCPPTQNKWEYTYNGSKSAPTTRTQHTAEDGIGGDMDASLVFVASTWDYPCRL